MKEIKIPTDVLQDKTLSEGAKIIYGIIFTYQVDTGGYFDLSNKQISQMISKSCPSVSRYIRELTDKQYLKLISFDYVTRKLDLIM